MRSVKTGHSTRREFLAGTIVGVPLLSSVGAAAQGRGARGGQNASAGPQLPLRSTGLEHMGLTVPDVAASGEFYGRLLNPALHREAEPPLRYYVTLGVGYLALGSVVIATGDAAGDAAPPRAAFIDHFCALADGYNPQAFRAELASAGIELGGGFGMVADPDGLRLQLLGVPGGMARTTVPAERVASDPPVVHPLGLDHVLLRVSDLERSAAHYRVFFGEESSRSTEPAQVWFRVAGTWLGLEAAGAGEAPSVGHFCINVAAFDQAAVTSTLRSLGAEILPAGTESLRSRFREQRRLRFRDPDGLTVELKGRVA